MLNEIQPIHWNAIIDSIRRETCVPFLGAGVNVTSDAIPYSGLPLASEVALRLARSLTAIEYEQLEQLTKEVADDLKLRLSQVPGAGPLPNLLRATLPDLSRVALEVQMGAGYQFLLSELRQILPDGAVEPSPMLKALASMRKSTARSDATSSPFKLIVTTNYDNLLERAFGQKPYELVVQSPTGVKDKTQLQKRLSKPKGTIIYKIHGSFSGNGDNADVAGQDNLILTEEEYIEFLSVMGRKDKGVPSLISSNMVKGTTLFLGYGLQDWDFRTIWQTMIKSIEEKLRPQSFAIQRNPPAYLKDYWREKNVTILDVDLYEFATELEARWNALPAQ
jgi:hypothetical protein